MDTEDLVALNASMEGKRAEERMEWALERYGKGLVMSTSFGVQSAVMLHLASRIHPDLPIIFVDTGYLFPETYRFARALQERLQLNLHTYVPRETAAAQEAIYGKRWEQGVEGLRQYNLINKVEPMNRAMEELGATAWLAGLRRSQASTRVELTVLQPQNRIMKIHPIIDWTDRMIYQYLQEYDLPYHPLWEKNYVSVGDWHSSKPLGVGERPEDTRFNGLKRECGLHELSGRIDFQI